MHWNRLREIRNTACLHWLLAALVVFSACLPAHYHLHHLTGEASGHAHAVDVHMGDMHVAMSGHSQHDHHAINHGGSDPAAPVHAGVSGHDATHHDAGITVIQAAPDRIAKDTSAGLLPLLAVAMLLFLLPRFVRLADRLIQPRDFGLVHSPPRLSPPLRAPPRL